MNQQNIRNFCIIAHIDHGKSTLADRFLGITNTIDKRKLIAQTLDSMDLEKEKGITIKLKSIRMLYTLDNTDYELNLIDTPGHVDFSYEVSRSLAACEGAILVVDATQGIQAQTVSNVFKAMDANLKIIPVLNKIDLTNAQVEKVTGDLCQSFGFKADEILKVSAKTGEGAKQLLEQVIKLVPPPIKNTSTDLRALVFDSYYDEHLGVIALVKIVDGRVDEGKTQLKLIASGGTFYPEEVGYLQLKRMSSGKLETGEVGYIATGLKDIKKVKSGDTITQSSSSARPLPGYKEIKPFVFVSIYPTDNGQYPHLRDALEKLSLSDSSLSFEPETNTALGFGFRCGFLGLLHADVVQERLEREYNLNLISTTPTVEYYVVLTNGERVNVRTPSQFPDRSRIDHVLEPWILTNIVTPSEYVGNIIKLCEERRGVLRKMDYPNESQTVFEYELPLAELVFNFFDDLKSCSSGFASLDYEFLDYREVDAVKMDILVHESVVDPLSHVILRAKAEEMGRILLKKLKEIIPRQQFKVSLQAAIGGKIIAREDIPAAGKNVLAKLSGGHRERKDKVLERQKKGKERMKRIGKVDIPQEAFRQILSS
ncbi:elongation factor 4 [candidate division WWE3 bacterium RIFOXYC1_FULL_40_10]|uniref:Elongation factor 4 n=1 Tax=candidate division WWE3 bacterium RIFOXYA2_FULL_46_9 TaxID=1802636 RepID=A0A1F4W120_UNCKA|nr:MAG: elongation factor 4 [candidate division WWE3 bacterium RIFOXYB1_FULL_40_22]OGC62050.1 MAG: elongation factor 4 [candidate division WWE3 bacterium RIFOXYA1_FULL_40_11]OGC62968.1 MAG: elongation factor 4 [candidate division WWE3 bacterium RIFOXYA2_FULL_46_9]OGC65005.1 MAG: elongation factor 4 [candidate division WWE3 bacterium RIFOXYB2_FULL_41_6]OGC66433.1 MAG: elongation factor 4 [candidate division WWE3 bacterium RIFOXYC1_FULL_40_10]OGC67243.1 MAG: elongation factor 4 [candidate divisi